MRNILILTFIFIPFLLPGQSPSELFESGNKAYQEEQYSDAINYYEQILDNDYISSELYYNLGNAYYKTDNIPFAILNFERAYKLNPDEDIYHNLTIARLKTVDKIEAVPEIFIVEWLNSISEWFSSSTWSLITIIFMWLTFSLFSLMLLFNSLKLKKFFFGLSVISLIFTGLTFYMSYNSHLKDFVKEFAIMTSPSSYIKSSPDSDSKDLFILHEGVKMEILDRVGNWYKIKIANGEVGWIQKDNAVLI